MDPSRVCAKPQVGTSKHTAALAQIRLLHIETQLGWGITDLLRDLREGEALMAAAAPSGIIGLSQETTYTVAALLQKSTDRLDQPTRHQAATAEAVVAIALDDLRRLLIDAKRAPGRGLNLRAGS